LNRITALFHIQYPIIQAGMIWCSGWELAAAVSQAGGLGLIGSGSMYPEVLRTHIRKCRAATAKPFGVNVPLLYPNVHELMAVILQEKVPIVFTSAGNPQTWTGALQDQGVKVAHVVSNVKFALKSAAAGVDALVAEGFEAGGHNGREETTTFCLLPLVRQAVDLPLMAAGGIANGRGLFGALALGAEGVQVGSRFAASVESSAHPHFKNSILAAREGDTQLSLKQLTPVRLLKNKFYQDVAAAERRGAGREELAALLGSRRAKRGMFEGDLDNGELEVGQAAALINKIQPAGDIVREMWQEFQASRHAFYMEYPEH
jgi:enoyl-[acyl-carrier protein] reductase II